MDYIDHVYGILKKEMEENLKSDTILEEIAIYLVGIRGFCFLIDNNLLSRCAVIEGHNVYRLRDKNTSFYGEIQ